MKMFVTFTTDCNFMFESWHSQGWGLYLVYLLMTAFISAATIALPHFKPKSSLEPTLHKKQLITKFMYYIAYSTLHVASMLLIMTYNGGVLIIMAIAMSLSYFKFGNKDTNADMPINCCAHS